MRRGLTLEGRFVHVLAALLLAAALMPLLAACGGADAVAIATVGNYHPFDFINYEGEIDGLERDWGTSCADAPIWSASGS